MDQDLDGFEPPEDCDDSDAAVNPAAFEVPYNGVDEDCDGLDLRDVDGDGYEAETVGGDDCGDGNAEIHPDAQEICSGSDEDCDAVVDEGCVQVDPADPGGFAWTCGTPTSPALLLIVLAASLLRSR